MTDDQRAIDLLEHIMGAFDEIEDLTVIIDLLVAAQALLILQADHPNTRAEVSVMAVNAAFKLLRHIEG